MHRNNVGLMRPVQASGTQDDRGLRRTEYELRRDSWVAESCGPGLPVTSEAVQADAVDAPGISLPGFRARWQSHLRCTRISGLTARRLRTLTHSGDLAMPTDPAAPKACPPVPSCPQQPGPRAIPQ